MAAAPAAKPSAGREEEQNTGCATHSFVGSTGVLMADGSSRPISQVKVGDQVADSVPGDATLQTHAVQKVIVTQTDRDFVDLTIKKLATTLGKAAAGLALAAAAVLGSAAPTSADTSTVTTTYHHPFYDVTQAAFVDAVDLHPGDQLQTADGTIAEVTVVRAYHQTATTYDLTIDGLHTYEVVTGDTAILVHNNNTGVELCGKHGGETGSPGGPGIVEGPAPATASDMLDQVKNRQDGIGKVPGYEGNKGWGNNKGALPGDKYREWDVNSTDSLPRCSVCGDPIRGPERLLTPKSGGGSSYYTPDHYGTFFYAGKL